MTAAVVHHVDNMFTVGQKERCEKMCVNLNLTIPFKILAELKWLTEDATIRGIAKKGVIYLYSNKVSWKRYLVLLPYGGFHLEDEETKNWPFRELVGILMLLVISTSPDIYNPVHLLQGTVPRLNPFTGKQCAWHSRTH